MATKRRRREYLQLLDAARAAIEVAVDSFNRVNNPYRDASTLILMTNAWELLAKAVLVQRHEPIQRTGRQGGTISPEVAVDRVKQLGLLDPLRAETIQQIISLRHEATHYVLPPIPVEVMHHLLFFGTKSFRDLVALVFPTHARELPEHFLSLSFASLTTYADKVQRSVARVRRSQDDQRLVWLLERGIAFDGRSYLTERQVAAKYHGKRKTLPYLEISKFLSNADMVRIVPVEAPRNYTADVTLRKGSARDASLPVVVKKTDVEKDFPYLTAELGARIGRGRNWVAKATTVLDMKGDARYHQEVRTSRSGSVQRYSEAALEKLRAHLISSPSFNPYAPQ